MWGRGPADVYAYCNTYLYGSGTGDLYPTTDKSSRHANAGDRDAGFSRSYPYRSDGNPSPLLHPYEYPYDYSDADENPYSVGQVAHVQAVEGA